MAMVPGKAPTPPTVTLKHLAAALAETHEMSKKQAETVLGDFVGNIVKHLKKGERIRIGGFGILQVRKRAARIGRNPATGEQRAYEPEVCRNPPIRMRSPFFRCLTILSMKSPSTVSACYFDISCVSASGAARS